MEHDESPSDAKATRMKDLFEAYLRAGFTENQALKLVVYYMVTTDEEKR